MTLSESLNAQALRELGEAKCAACGAAKNPKQSFCRTCYFKLPQAMRLKLYKTFSEGYGTNYDEAKEWLRISTP